MLSEHDNQLVTQVGPGTPGGAMFRRYWLPFALSSELAEPDGPPIRVRLLGEDLIAFRTTKGDVALVGAYCPHRRAPMFFGRNEENGLRCVYHGWKFDDAGRCVDMPSEPPDSLFKDKVRIDAYPTYERGDLLWTYMGPPDQQPAPPDYEFLRAPATHRHVSKTFESANYLQALEGGLDTAHSSFLHQMNIKDQSSMRTRDKAPRLEVERTDYGFRYAGIRKVGIGQYVRAYQYVMPSQQMRGYVTAPSGVRHDVPSIHGHVWVPIDDTHTWTFNFMYSFDETTPLTHEFCERFEILAGRGPDDLTPDFHLKRNYANDYLIDRELQKNQTFTGITGINTQDIALQEGMGPIVDRTKEHLGTSDRAIIAARQLLLEAIADVQSGKAPRGAASVLSAQVRPVDVVISEHLVWQDALAGELTAKF